MATYKLLQDIEAEDHILGPLSLRQFIFALVAAFMYYLCFLFFSNHVPFLIALPLPIALFFTFFAFPFGKDQPTEIWALAKLRFLFKPRRRVWDQSGVKEMVTITAPKKLEPVLTNGLSQVEVKSRLTALASTLDSRGWATKNVDVNAYANPMQYADPNSDRLVSASAAPQPVPDYDVPGASADILDETSNPIAQQFTTMIDQSERAHRQQVIDRMNGVERQAAAPFERPIPAAPVTAAASYQPAAAPVDYWFMNGAGSASPNTQFVVPGQTTDQPVDPEEAALTARLKAAHDSVSPKASFAHMRTLQPLGSQPPMPAPVGTGQVAAPTNTNDNQAGSAMADPADAAILSLANNNDLNVATLAREASKARHPEESDGEVVISLH